ncbi:MAG: PD-(D/E)XK nuclease family protein [Alphaproteobacteria bacterium]|nr:PD-(D/E)XK nuclease family protein [Alphaproteobacteria bacterium]
MPELKLEELRKEPHWSYSSLNTYLNICSLQYYFRYVEKAEAEQTSSCFPFGRAFHTALSEQARSAMKGKSLTLTQITEVFREFFKAECACCENLKFKEDESIDTMISKAENMLTQALANWRDFWNIKGIAVPFSYQIPGVSKVLIGEYDIVVQDNDRPCIVDWKTSAQKWNENKVQKDLQATTFSYSFYKTQALTPSFRFDVITKGKNPSVESHYTQRGLNEFQRFEKIITSVEKAVKADVFLPSETSFSCADCAYANRCRNWHITNR